MFQKDRGNLSFWLPFGDPRRHIDMVSNGLHSCKPVDSEELFAIEASVGLSEGYMALLWNISQLNVSRHVRIMNC